VAVFLTEVSEALTHSPPTAQTVTRPVSEEELAGWLASLDRLFMIPPEYRDEAIDRPAALEMLQFDGAVLDRLIAAGLPAGGEPGAERFDRFDLVNLALYARSGRSVPEQTMRYALRWMHESPDEQLFRPKRWTFSVEVSCGQDTCDPDARRFAIANPRPQWHDGRVEELTVSPDAVVGDVDIELAGAPGLSVSGVLVTNGDRRTIRSPRLREIVSQYSPADYRWARMPEELQWRPELVLSQGYAPCIAACTVLAEQCRAAGYPARTRRGWIMGMLDLAHSWLEVVDDDGQIKTVDPAFRILAAHHAERPHPEFVEVCTGSLLNRLLPTEHEANQPVMTHDCGGRRSAPRHRTNIKIADDQSALEGMS
jgi:Transglutaminase-like superfamily